MADFVRRIVSGPKARYVDEKLGFDLDLVYVTDRLIIMGWPASNIEALYRNRRKDVRKFLDAKHGEQYRVYNLCPCSENSYDADDFYGAVSRYPFPDHHPPPLSMIPMFVADMTAYFAEDPRNVAVIHCKAGKGRSGTMACAYLLSLPLLPPSPQSSRNCGNEHDRQLLEDHKAARKAAKAAKGDVQEESMFHTSTKDSPLSLVQSPVSSSTQDGENHEQKLRELTARLDAVFEFHTSRRLKPTKRSTSSQSKPLRSPKSMIGLGEGNDMAAAAAMQRGQSSEKANDASSPLRPKKSLSNLVGTLSRKASRLGLEPMSQHVRSPSPSKRETLGSKSSTNLRALGANPAGTSPEKADLTDSPSSLPVIINIASDTKSNPWSSTTSIGQVSSQEDNTLSRQSSMGLLSLFPGEQKKSRSQLSSSTGESESQGEIKDKAGSGAISPTSIPRSLESSPSRRPMILQDTPTRIDSPDEYSGETDTEKDEAEIPKLAVSIPSQRRWVGYWARMLAGMDPRAALDSHLMHPSRRQVKILSIFVDRRDVRGEESDRSEGHLSVQIARYNEKLVDKVESWERSARRRQRAFGALDPGAPSTKLLPSELEEDDEQEEEEEEEGKAEKKAKEVEVDKEAAAERKRLREKDEERRWKDCEKRNLEHREEYDRKLRQHGNDSGVGQWGINVMAERDTIRHFHWNDDDGHRSPDQMETVAMVSEARRVRLSKSKADPMLSKVDLTAKMTEEPSVVRYIFEPGEAKTTHYGARTPQMTWTKPSAAASGLTNLVSRALSSRKSPEVADQAGDPSNSSCDTTNSRSSGWTQDQSHSTEPPSPITSDDEYTRRDVEQGGVIIDADREVQFRVLLGRSGATHSKLPDILSAGYLWLIPAFETPTLHHGKVKPKVGQVVKCQFGVGEIDFRKGKKSAPLTGGGDIRSITVEFQWVEVGWHEADEEDNGDQG